MVSESGLHQLHIFIFILAVVHVMCAVATMALGRAKVCTKTWFWCKIIKKNFIIFLLLFCLDLCNLFRWENGRLGRRRHRLFSTKWPMVCWLILKCSQLNSVYMRRKRDFNLHVLQIQKGLDSSEKHHLQEDI